MFNPRLNFLKSEFFQNVSYQVVGTGLAQLLPFAVTPFLTRLYSQEDFAIYTSFFAVVSILVVGVGGRYQLAIVLPKTEEDAKKVFALSIYITMAYTILLAITSWVFQETALNHFGLGIYLIPVYVLVFGIWSSFTYLSVRNKTFLHNAIAKVGQSIGYVFLALGLGLIKYTLLGLVVAKLAGVLVSAIYLIKKAPLRVELPDLASLQVVAKKYADYPKYGLVPSFLDIVSVQGLVLILAKFYSTVELGLFGLTAMVLSAPLGLVGGSFRDVFYQRMTSLINATEFVKAKNLLWKSALGLFLVGLPICIAIFFFGGDIFGFVFGEKWRTSGDYASILSLSFLIQLIVSPLSSVFNAADRVKTASAWQVLYFVSTFSTLGICSYVLELSIDNLLMVYVMHEIFLYSIYFVLQYWTLKNLK